MKIKGECNILEADYISYKDVRDLKAERDVLEKVFLERQFNCDKVAREYYFDKKQKSLACMTASANKEDKQSKNDFKKAQRELYKLCIQFGHDAPCPSNEEEKVTCRCCGEKYNYEELLESYYRRTKFSRMILFDYIKNQPFFINAQLIPIIYDEDE